MFEKKILNSLIGLSGALRAGGEIAGIAAGNVGEVLASGAKRMGEGLSESPEAPRSVRIVRGLLKSDTYYEWQRKYIDSALKTNMLTPEETVKAKTMLAQMSAK